MQNLLFPNIINLYVDPTWLIESTVVAHRKYAAHVNKIPGVVIEYRLVDMLMNCKILHYLTEFLNSFEPWWLPQHILKFKICCTRMCFKEAEFTDTM